MPRRRTSLEHQAAALAEARDAHLGEDRAWQKAHGVVHTPPVLARAMARIAHDALDAASARAGLYAQGLVIVDPACGPGVFLSAVLDELDPSRTFAGRLVGVDIDARAIAMARELLEPTCRTRSIPLELNVADTLALDPASFVRDAERVLVIGNPPWAARTPLRGQTQTEAMLEAWKRDAAGEPLGEKKIGVLSDAYVRFFRFCAEIVRCAPLGGVLALVTNGSFLDGPVHRGMRGSLLRWFEHVDVLDLGGSALVAMDGVRDENVFGVRPTVAITVASRAPSHRELIPGATMRYARVRGSKTEKLAALDAMSSPLAPMTPEAPLFAFRPTPKRGTGEDCLALDAIFMFHREGVQTNRDRAVVAPDRASLLERLRAFVRGDAEPDLESAYVPSGHYDPARARENVRAMLERDPDGSRGESVRRIAYRPFDERVYAPIAPFCHRPRLDLARAIDRAALTLVTVRKDRGEAAWTHFGAVAAVPDNCLLSNRSSCRTRAFPSHDAEGNSNVSARAVHAIEARTGVAPSAREITAYVLAVLASATYRASFADVLRLEYPDVPLPEGRESFEARVRAGEALASAFLTARGECHAKIGHYSIEFAPSALSRALEDAESAFTDRG